VGVCVLPGGGFGEGGGKDGSVGVGGGRGEVLVGLI
jgi:hypothetical protein